MVDLIDFICFLAIDPDKTPTLTFIIGVWVNHEVMSTARWVGFFIIWIALFALAYDLVRSGRAVNNSIA